MSEAGRIGEDGLRELLVDGLHLSGRGYRVVTDGESVQLGER